MADEQVTNGQGEFEGYQDLNGLRKGYLASSQEAKRLAAENQQMGARLQNLEQRFIEMTAVNQRQSIPQRGSAAERLIDQGFDANLLAEYVDERVTPKFQQFLEPLVKAQQARMDLLAENPDYLKFESEQAAYLHSNPAVAEVYNSLFPTHPKQAMKYLSDEYSRSVAKSQKGTRRDTRQETVHAQIPSDRTGETRRQPEGEADLMEARSRLRETRNAPDAVRDFARLRLKQAITDDFLNQ